MINNTTLNLAPRGIIIILFIRTLQISISDHLDYVITLYNTVADNTATMYPDYRMDMSSRISVFHRELF